MSLGAIAVPWILPRARLWSEHDTQKRARKAPTRWRRRNTQRRVVAAFFASASRASPPAVAWALLELRDPRHSNRSRIRAASGVVTFKPGPLKEANFFLTSVRGSRSPAQSLPYVLNASPILVLSKVAGQDSSVSRRPHGLPHGVPP